MSTFSAPRQQAGIRCYLRHPLIGFFVLIYGFSRLAIAVLAVLGAPAALVIAAAIPGPTSAP